MHKRSTKVTSCKQKSLELRIRRRRPLYIATDKEYAQEKTDACQSWSNAATAPSYSTNDKKCVLSFPLRWSPISLSYSKIHHLVPRNKIKVRGVYQYQPFGQFQNNMVDCRIKCDTDAVFLYVRHWGEKKGEGGKGRKNQYRSHIKKIVDSERFLWHLTQPFKRLLLSMVNFEWIGFSTRVLRKQRVAYQGLLIFLVIICIYWRHRVTVQ